MSTGLKSPVWLVAFVVTLFLGTWLKYTNDMNERRTNSEHPSLTNYPAGRGISPTKQSSELYKDYDVWKNVT